MLVKRRGGMTEFIPSPKEKREALVRDHFAEVAALLHRRLARIETELGLPDAEALACETLLERMGEEERRSLRLHQALRVKDARTKAP